MTSQFVVTPGGSLSGELRVPGDKSISHRAAIFAGLADGISHIDGFLHSDDCLATLRAVQQLGATVSDDEKGRLAVTGCAGAFTKVEHPLDLGNAGTGLRLLAGVLAGQKFKSTLTGDVSLRSRPMQRIIEPLQQMGAAIASADGKAPLQIVGKYPLRAIDYVLPVASAQVSSCVLLAGLCADGATTVTSPAPIRDHTERLLQAMGAPIEVGGGRTILHGPATLQATNIVVPGDFSSAAFFIGAAAVSPGSEIELRGVGINPGRTGLIKILWQMGADISVSNRKITGGEEIADIAVRGRRLRGIDVDKELVPASIDELPMLFVVAALADGTTTVRGAAELRVKESDRIATMAIALTKLGIAVQESRDGLEIAGAGGFSGGGELECAGDHRVAMALSLAGMFASKAVVVRNVDNVATSYPQFAEHAAALGVSIALEPTNNNLARPSGAPGKGHGQRPDPVVPVVAVDGPSGSGKGTLSRMLAEKLGWHLLDSGALYRLTALAALDAGADPRDEAAVAAIAASLKASFDSDEAGNERILLDGQDVTLRIRSERCGAAASKVAPLAAVRESLSGLQLGFRRLPGLVADGRDMGTVVFPDAGLKIFLTASADERAERRYKQLKEKGIGVSLAALREEIAERDRRDQSREIAPLVPAADALVFDTTGVGIEEVFESVFGEVKKVYASAGVQD